MVDVTPILIDANDPSKGAILKIQYQGQTWYRTMKTQNRYFEQVMQPEVQAANNYIQALHDGEDLTEVTLSLPQTTFLMISSRGEREKTRSTLSFGSVGGRGAQIPLNISGNVEVEVTPIMIDPNDPSRGAILKIQYKDEIWYRAMKPQPVYFGEGLQPEVQTVNNYIQALYDGQELTEVTLDLPYTAFRMKTTAGENAITRSTLIFGPVGVRTAQIPLLIPGDVEVDVTAIKIDPYDPSKGAILKIQYEDETWYRTIKPEPVYFERTLQPEVQAVKNYIQALHDGEDLTNVTLAQPLVPFKMTTVGSESGIATFSFGAIEGRTAQIRIQIHPGHIEIDVIPILIDPNDPSRGVILKIQYQDQTFYRAMKSQSPYFERALHPEVQAVNNYIQALSNGEDVTESTLSLPRSTFKMKTSPGNREASNLSFGKVNEEFARFGLWGIPANVDVEVTPIFIDSDNPSRGAYLMIQYQDKQWLYRITTSGGHFLSHPTPSSSPNVINLPPSEVRGPIFSSITTEN